MPIAKQVKANETDVAKRTIAFDLRDAIDGISIETGETGGQPEISLDGVTWTSTGIGILSAIGQGRYTATVEQSVIASPGVHVRTRFKSANTAETPGGELISVASDPYEDIVAAVTASVVASLSTAPGIVVAPGGENTMTVSDAVAYSRSALSDTEDGTYPTAMIEDAIRSVTAELVRISDLNRTIQTIALTQGSETVDLSALAGFRAERVTYVERSDHTQVELFDYVTVAKELNVSTSEGKPSKIAFGTPTTGYIYPVPESSQSLMIHYWFPVNEFTMSEDIIQIPATYLRPALWWGVPGYLEHAHGDPVLAEPKWRKFVAHAHSIRAEMQGQDITIDEAFIL